MGLWRVRHNWATNTCTWQVYDVPGAFLGEGNGNPFQYSCRENPRDGRAWWAAVYGVAQDPISPSTWGSPGNEGQSKPTLQDLGVLRGVDLVQLSAVPPAHPFWPPHTSWDTIGSPKCPLSALPSTLIQPLSHPRTSAHTWPSHWNAFPLLQRTTCLHPCRQS